MPSGNIKQFLKNRYVVSDHASETDALSQQDKSSLPSDDKISAKPDPQKKPTADTVTVTKIQASELLAEAYGWWVLLDDKRVASLEFRSVLEESVHLYAVTVLDKKFFEINLDPALWATPKLVIQSRYAEKFKQTSLEMASVGNDMIVVENLEVPDSYLKEKANEIKKFHDELVAKANEPD